MPDEQTELIYNLVNTQEQRPQTAAIYNPLKEDGWKAENCTKWAIADINQATAFQIRANLILNGMAELRSALAYSQVNGDERPNDNGVPIFKNTFDETGERTQLKKKYGAMMDLYFRFISQLDPSKS